MSTPLRLPRLLDALQRLDALDNSARAEIDARQPPPWWLAILLAGAAWLASLIVLGAFFAPLLALGDGRIARATGGIILIGTALALFRRRAPFTDQMALAFSLAGQALLISAIAERFFDLIDGSNEIALTAFALGALLALAPASTLHRSLCLASAIANLAWLIGPGRGLAVLGIALAASACALWLARAHWAATPLAPLTKALAHAATLTALILAPYGNASSALDLVGDLLLDPKHTHLVVPLYRTGAALVFVATAAWLGRAAGALRVPLVAAAVLTAGLAWSAPGLLIGGALLLAAFQACHRAWTLAILAFCTLYLGEFYYSLHSTLLAKSLVIGASGLWLLGLRAGLRHFAGRSA